MEWGVMTQIVLIRSNIIKKKTRKWARTSLHDMILHSGMSLGSIYQMEWESSGHHHASSRALLKHGYLSRAVSNFLSSLSLPILRALSILPKQSKQANFFPLPPGIKLEQSRAKLIDNLIITNHFSSVSQKREREYCESKETDTEEKRWRGAKPDLTGYKKLLVSQQTMRCC